MLLFQAQGGVQEGPKEKAKGFAAAFVEELVEKLASRKAGNEQPEGRQTYFMASSHGQQVQKQGPFVSSPDLERAIAKLDELRSRDKKNAVDDFLTRAAKKAESLAGPAPKGRDLLASIEHEKKIHGLVIRQMSDVQLKKLEKEIDRA